MPVKDAVVHLDAAALARQMSDDVRAGLTASPKTLSPKYFYDARGSELFDEITRLPEYYPTRTERSILDAHVADVARLTGAETLVELGSGTSEKTRLLLRALSEAGSLRRFVPFDVDPAVLKDASAAVAEEFPALEVEPVVGDFEKHLGELPRHPRRLLAFLGSTIGNLEPAVRARFLAAARGTLDAGDAFLLGTDLVKSPERLVAAYDDAQGVTAAFNRNVLRVLDRDLDADFDPDRFQHRAVWDAEREWIEMRLESTREQRVTLRALDLDVRFARGEQMRTEISAKFRRDGRRGRAPGSRLRARRLVDRPRRRLRGVAVSAGLRQDSGGSVAGRRCGHVAQRPRSQDGRDREEDSQEDGHPQPEQDQREDKAPEDGEGGAQPGLSVHDDEAGGSAEHDGEHHDAEELFAPLVRPPLVAGDHGDGDGDHTEDAEEPEDHHRRDADAAERSAGLTQSVPHDVSSQGRTDSTLRLPGTGGRSVAVGAVDELAQRRAEVDDAAVAVELGGELDVEQ